MSTSNVLANHLKKHLLVAKSPLLKYTSQSLREKLFLGWIYNSNALEGNTLTINETKVVLEGIKVDGKTIREHLEVINHRDAIEGYDLCGYTIELVARLKN